METESRSSWPSAAGQSAPQGHCQEVPALLSGLRPLEQTLRGLQELRKPRVQLQAVPRALRGSSGSRNKAAELRGPTCEEHRALKPSFEALQVRLRLGNFF